MLGKTQMRAKRRLHLASTMALTLKLIARELQTNSLPGKRFLQPIGRAPIQIADDTDKL